MPARRGAKKKVPVVEKGGDTAKDKLNSLAADVQESKVGELNDFHDGKAESESGAAKTAVGGDEEMFEEVYEEIIEEVYEEDDAESEHNTASEETHIDEKRNGDGGEDAEEGEEGSHAAAASEEKTRPEDEDAATDYSSEKRRSKDKERGAESDDERERRDSDRGGGNERDDSEKRPERRISPIQWDKGGSRSPRQRRARSRDDSRDSERRFRTRSRSQSRGTPTPPQDYNRKLDSLFRDGAFFIIKSANHENVSLAKAKGVWSTPKYNQMRIDKAFKECRNVILIFSVKESGFFQGFARVAAESTTDHPVIRWVLPGNFNPRKLSRVFKLDWISRRELMFDKTTHLHNEWNESKPVKIGMDGQDVETNCAEALCRLFPIDERIDIDAIIEKSRRHGDRIRARGTRDYSPEPEGDVRLVEIAAAAAAGRALGKSCDLLTLTNICSSGWLAG